jgi:ribosomal protein L11 methyltransferase
MAFGTGEHATTRGVFGSCNRSFDQATASRIWVGKGVLAIAAAKLGALYVAAIELDHDAIENAEQNVARNDVQGRVAVIEGDAATLLPLVAPVES